MIEYNNDLCIKEVIRIKIEVKSQHGIGVFYDLRFYLNKAYIHP